MGGSVHLSWMSYERREADDGLRALARKRTMEKEGAPNFGKASHTSSVEPKSAAPEKLYDVEVDKVSSPVGRQLRTGGCSV